MDRSCARCWWADRASNGFMVTVRFRVRLGLGSRVRVKVRLPFAFVILRDRSIALRDRAIAQNRSNVHNTIVGNLRKQLGKHLSSELRQEHRSSLLKSAKKLLFKFL